MRLTTKIILFFACVVAYKALSNLINLARIKFYQREFLNYLADNPNEISQYKLQTIKLFKNAGIQDVSTPIAQPMGYGTVANVPASVFTNFPSKMSVIAQPAFEMFENAVGVYRSRIIESFNPLYWIELVVFLPKNILTYVGADLEKSAIKLCNVVLTIVWWAICTAATFYRSEIQQFLIKLLGKL